eukprot:TRINITY_DN12187_c0_g1_i6.p3 TRINITY_DN12187_c0_g1~~TRINITY_DN12187_c0_g1_i6.p3  ORF type:complete len:170 (-),score=26.68 TRINITY_DN12187_c0_g1_i6:2060-2569(-)
MEKAASMEAATFLLIALPKVAVTSADNMPMTRRRSHGLALSSKTTSATDNSTLSMDCCVSTSGLSRSKVPRMSSSEPDEPLMVRFLLKTFAANEEWRFSYWPSLRNLDTVFLTSMLFSKKSCDIITSNHLTSPAARLSRNSSLRLPMSFLPGKESLHALVNVGYLSLSS